MIINDLKKDPYSVLNILSIKEITQILKEANQSYYNKQTPMFSDETYEIIRSYLEKLDPDNPIIKTEIGAPVKNKVKLPFWMGSLDKIKSGVLPKWQECVLSDKLDGISCLLCDDKIYTRGDGQYGQDITHLLQYIKIPKTKDTIRGELIISKDNWKKIIGYSNPRNTVAGLANAKKPDPEVAKLVSFVAYSLIEPAMPPSKGLEYIKQQGFETVYHKSVKSITLESLTDFLLERRKHSEYEIDGIVVEHDKINLVEEGKNPSYAFAFKSIITQEKGEVTVKEIKWGISKNGLLKPVAHFDRVYLSGVHIERATCHNAQFVFKNKLGPGSRIVIIRSGDVIPYILEILSPSTSGEPSMPDKMLYPWKWHGEVEISLVDPHLANEYHVKQLENYAVIFNIKGLGIRIIKKLYEYDVTNIKKLANVTKVTLYKATRSSKLTTKIYKQLQEIFNRARCIDFMAASNVFGAGIGLSKFKLITESFPSVQDPEMPLPSVSDLLKTKGIGERVARQFLSKIEEFHEFMADAGLPCKHQDSSIEPTPEGCMSVFGKNIVFTGFRSAELASLIEKRGGKITSGVSYTTSILVAKNINDDSIKSETAKELGIPIMTYADFIEEICFKESTPKKQEEDDFDAIREELEKEGFNLEEESSGEEQENNTLNKKAECVRHAANWSKMKRYHIFGKQAFDLKKTLEDLPSASPKLDALIKKIKELDQKDMTEHGDLFKHMIFSDVSKRGYGAKIIASALAANGFKHAYDQDLVIKNKSSDTFAILASTQVFTKPINVKFKKELLTEFNKRPGNIHGKNIRIMVLDTGYKEGIDLFDVKYVHLFEPLLTVADRMQAIGRAIRFCGQRGLSYEQDGWKVHVYEYEHVLPDAKESYTLILELMNWSQNVQTISNEIEKAAKEAAVDRLLNKNIHSGGANEFKWPKIEKKNMCIHQKDTIEFSPTQKFIRSYFQPDCPIKGMFLYNSPGSGKTCTAIACASYSWEASGYTILWVTRGTLKTDLYKNMFDQSCMERIRDYLAKGNNLPEELAAKKRLLSHSWLPPISYKQFSNCLQRQNKLYDYLIKKNGFSDPFKKTLIIIDEAHLMYSPSMKEREKPDTRLLKSWLRNSYQVSGKHSARVILMTATPITNNPFVFSHMMNMLNMKDNMPEDPDAFIKRYLNSKSKFTKEGLKAFKEDTKGQIGYLNRMKDASQFAQPIYHSVKVSVSKPTDFSKVEKHIDLIIQEIEKLKEIKLEDTKKKLALEIANKKEVAEKAKVIISKAKEDLASKKDMLKELRTTVKEGKKGDMNVLSVISSCIA